MPATVVGYSLLHYAIVRLPSKNKKATKKSQLAVIASVQNDHPERLIMKTTFRVSVCVDNAVTPEEVWVVEYIRPSRDNAMTSAG